MSFPGMGCSSRQITDMGLLPVWRIFHPFPNSLFTAKGQKTKAGQNFIPGITGMDRKGAWKRA
jgi:hypothetical protein